VSCSELQCVAVSCSVLQCVRSLPSPSSLRVCCSVLQCVAVCCSVLTRVALCSCVLQYAAVCCSELQCVAVCCSVLQCVTVCCSVRTPPLSSLAYTSMYNLSDSVWLCQSQRKKWTVTTDSGLERLHPGLQTPHFLSFFLAWARVANTQHNHLTKWLSLVEFVQDRCQPRLWPTRVFGINSLQCLMAGMHPRANKFQRSSLPTYHGP